MGKRLLAGVLALCLLLGGCSADRENSSSSGAEDLIVMEGISPGEETPPSRIWIPLGVYSGKTPGGTAELPDGFICTQPLTNCYQSEINSENGKVTSVAITIQDTRNPNEITLRHNERNLGDVELTVEQVGAREVLSYTIGTADGNNSERLLQPEDRYYRHVLEFDEGPYFVSVVYTAKEIENQEAQKQMLQVVESIQIDPPDQNDPIYGTFEAWSNLGIMAPFLFQNSDDLTVEELQELYLYYCACTHTPVYEWSQENGEWEEIKSYSYDAYAKPETLCLFGTDWFGKQNLSAADFLQPEDSIMDAGMVLLDYDGSESQFNRPKNWLNDVYLLEGRRQGDQITLNLRYYYTRTAAMPELESLDCTVTAAWTEHGPVFESCQITDRTSATSEPEFSRFEVQVPQDLLARADLQSDPDLLDVFYVALGLEDQGYLVYQNGPVLFTQYIQITDSGAKVMGFPEKHNVPGYVSVSFDCWRADGSYKSPTESYLLSCSIGKIVSLTAEENEILLRGSTEDKEKLTEKLFQ